MTFATACRHRWAAPALCTALLATPLAAAATPDLLPLHLAALRLQGPVLIDGHPGRPLEERMKQLGIPGVSAAVCADGEIRWAEAWGWADEDAAVPVTPETLFQAASISKPVAAAGVLRQVDEGQLELDRDVNDYLRSWRLPTSEAAAGEAVTLERLLSHSAGLTVHGFRGYAEGEPVPTVSQILDGKAPANSAPVRVDLEPGSRFRYSGGGTTVAQLVLSDTTGEPFAELLERTVLAPAGMRSSTYEQPLPPELRQRAATGYRRDGSEVAGRFHTYPEQAAAGLWTTPSDLCRFAMAIQRSRAGEPEALLSRQSALRMTTLLTDVSALGFFVDPLQDGDRLDVGDGDAGETYFGHNGANEGFRSLLNAHRDRGFAVAVMVNSDNGSTLAAEIERSIARRDGWHGYLPEALPVIPLTAEEAGQLAGRYRVHGDQAFEIVATGDGLTVEAPRAEPAPLYAVAHGELARPDRESRYHYELPAGEASESAGAVTRITVVRPPRGDQSEERIVAERLAAVAKLPSDWLAAGELERAADAYRALYAESPEDPGVDEARLNALGYELAGRGELARALTVLEVNTELYPASANTWDSLAEISLESGDRQRALELYRKVLETLSGDEGASGEFWQRLRSGAEAKIRELSE